MTSDRIRLLLGFAAALLAVATANARLNCDFESDCCWHSPDGTWTQTEKADEPWFRRIFRGIGRKGLPAGAFVSKTVVGKEAKPQPWESCDFCSATGVVNVDFRHWQSPTAITNLCWSVANQTRFDSEQCEIIHSYNSEDALSLDLYVPKNTPIKIGFLLTNRGSRSQAVAVIDKVHVQTEFCSLNVRRLPTVVVHKKPKVIPTTNFTSVPAVTKETPPPTTTTVQTTSTTTLATTTTTTTLATTKAPATVVPLTFPTLFPPLKFTLPPMFSITPGPLEDILRSMPQVPGFPLPKARQAPGMSAPRKISIQKRPAPAMTIKAKPTPKPSDDPLTDMFGKEFVDFLSPDFDSTKSDGDENSITEDDSVKLETKGDVCNTVGGCLFDHGMCGYRNSKILSNKGKFVRGISGKSVFVETRLQPGDVAVFETRTRMEEPHVVLFDWLEFTEGEKLSACCYTPGRTPQDLVCPMESESYTTTDIVWKPGRIECPTNTTKIMFICENYGRVDGVCALDTIRLFKQSDVAMQFPCQQSVFAQKQL
uniref:MAM domain-containing protein n=1 Tax=Steinernema glaseri TaxID=37863 RepID=A0A1I7Z014_9BILA